MAKQPPVAPSISADPDELLTYLTGDGLSVEERDSQARERRQWARISRTLLDGDPNAMLTTLRARSISTAGAHGFVYLRDTDYYDAIDEALDKDMDILSALQVFVALALRRGWELLPAKHGSNDQRAGELRDLVEERVLRVESECFGFDHLIDMLPTYRLAHGLSVCEILWEVRDGRYEPLAYPHRHPGQFAADEIGRLMLLDDASRRGRADRLGTARHEDYRQVPANKFVTLRTGGRYGNPYGQSLVEAMKYVYEVKRLTLRSWLNYVRNYGTPLGIGKVSGGGLGAGTDENRVQHLLQELKDILKGLSETAGVVLRPEQIIEFQERGRSNSGETAHERLYRAMQRQTYRIVFGSILHMMEAEFGTRAQASEHSDVAEIKARPLASKLEASVNRGLIRPYIEINEGADALADAPMLRFDVDDSVIVDEAIRILESGQRLGLPLSIQQAQEWLGLRMPDGDDDVLEVRSVPSGDGDGDGDGDDDAPPFAEPGDPSGDNTPRVDEFAEGARARRKRAVGIEAAVREIVERAAGELASRGIEELRRSFLAALESYKQLEAGAPDTQLLMPSAIEALSGTPLDTDGEFAREIAAAMLAVRALTRLGVWRDLQAAGVTPQFAAADGAQASRFDDAVGVDDLLAGLPVEVRDALVWLKATQALTDQDLRDIVVAMTGLGWPSDPTGLANIVREEARHLAGAINTQVSDRVRAVVERAVDQGLTHAEFLEAMDQIIAEGGLPGATDAYLENVFRTESAQVYTLEQDTVLAEPEVGVFVWGFEFFNPKDDRSRDSHAAMSGKMIRKGSAADLASRPGPPWSYQCRCVRAALIAADVENSGFEESDGALATALALERF